MQHTEMDLESIQRLPIIDLSLGLKLARNNQSLADDMLRLVIESLPENLDKIKALAEQNDIESLNKAIHKLHGATCYIGTPRLKSYLSYLESNFKNHIMDSSLSLIDQLEVEIKLLLEDYYNLQKHPST